MSDIDDLIHLLKHAAAQQEGDFKPFIYGHVANYDPQLHRVRVIYPSIRDQNNKPVLSPWMPLGSLMAGSGFGIQYAPMGGASFENPTAGEQVKVSVFERDGSIQTAADIHFTQKMLPPFPNMKPGELGLKSPGGSFVYMHENSDIELSSAAKVIIDTATDVSVYAQGNANIAAGGSVNLAGGGPSIARLGDEVVCPAGVGHISQGSSKATCGG